MPKEDASKLKSTWKIAYRAYTLQLTPPQNRFVNRYNLFYDINYWDRHWFKKAHKFLAKRGRYLRSG
jgi:hypothetical protein